MTVETADSETYGSCGKGHGKIPLSQALKITGKTGVKYQCPISGCKSFLGKIPPQSTQAVTGSPSSLVGKIGGIPVKDSELHYCETCGAVRDIRAVPTKQGIRKTCGRCGSGVVSISEDTLRSLPPPPDDEALFPDDGPDVESFSFNDPESQRLNRILDQVGLGKKKRAFVMEVFQQTPQYRNPESLFSFLHTMGLGNRSKVICDYTFSSTPNVPTAQPGPYPASPPGSGMGMSNLRDRLIEASIVAKELQLLGLVPSGSVGVDAKGNAIIQQTQGTTPEDLFRYFSEGMQMAIKLGAGQGTDLESEIARVKAIQGLTTTSPASAEVASIQARLRLAEMKHEDDQTLAIAELSDKRAGEARTQKTIEGAVEVAKDAVREITPHIGATLGQHAKAAMTGQQGQQGQGPTPADQLSPEQRAEVLTKIEEYRRTLDAREAEVMAQGAPSVAVEVVREKGPYMDIPEGD